MTPKSEKWLGIIVLLAMTLSLASYFVAYIVYHSQIAKLPHALGGQTVVEGVFACFGVLLIWWIVRALQSAKLKGLFGLLLGWFLVFSSQAFHSAPSVELVLGIGIALELAMLVLWLRPTKQV